MKLVNNIFIRSSPETVWLFLQNPENMLLWNKKVTHLSPSVFSKPQQGYRYAITYQLNENALACKLQAEFVQFDPFLKLVIRLTEEPTSPHNNRVFEETYELSERNGGTFLTQTIRVENSGINIFWRLLFWVVGKIGKPTGKPYLETLRDIIESDAGKDGGQIK